MNLVFDDFFNMFLNSYVNDTIRFFFNQIESIDFVHSQNYRSFLAHFLTKRSLNNIVLSLKNLTFGSSLKPHPVWVTLYQILK